MVPPVSATSSDVIRPNDFIAPLPFSATACVGASVTAARDGGAGGPGGASRRPGTACARSDAVSLFDVATLSVLGL